MSTKIYNGVKFTCDIFELQKNIAARRVEMAQERMATLRHRITDRLLRNIDFGLNSSNVPIGTDVHDVVDQIIEDTRKEFKKVRRVEARPMNDDKSKEGRFIDDHISVHGMEESSIVVVPYNNELYGLTFNCDILKDDNGKKLGMVDYAYWNNTDEPEDMSEEEWNERADLWDEIFKQSWIPSEVGMTSILAPATICDLWTFQTIIEEVCSRDGLISFIEDATGDFDEYRLRQTKWNKAYEELSVEYKLADKYLSSKDIGAHAKTFDDDSIIIYNDFHIIVNPE